MRKTSDEMEKKIRNDMGNERMMSRSELAYDAISGRSPAIAVPLEGGIQSLFARLAAGG